MSPRALLRSTAIATAAALLVAAPARAHAQAACEAVAGNLVQNCGFEAGGAGWTTGGIGTSTSAFYVHSGSVGLSGGAVGGLGFWSQAIATTPGETYTVSFWYNSTGYYTNALFASFGDVTLVDRMNLPAEGWTRFSYTAEATSESSVLRLGLRNDPSYDAIDDVSVTGQVTASTVTPEPGTWALLGTGLAGLAGVATRRRRTA